MNTHDEETKKFFKNTGVRCILAPRYADDKVSWVRQKVHSQNHLKSFKLAK
jgi:phospholipase D1/2